jgi:nucleotidyltransferase substrate binding protein (TIGR01987 family)
MKLDLSSFKKAMTSFKEAIDKYAEDKNNLFVRDSVIQRFECSYSLSLKMIKRYLEVNGMDNVDTFTFNEMIRTANENGLLLSNLEKWNDFRLKRNITSHTYDAKKADEITSIVDDFYKEVSFLFDELNKRNG